MSRTALIVALVVVVAAGAAGLYAFGSRSSQRSYERVADIVADINDHDVACTDYKRLEEEHPTLKEFGLCYLDGGEYEVDIYLFETAADLTGWLDQLTQQVDEGVLVGPNWLLTAGTDENARAIQDGIGGNLVTE